MIVLKVDMLVKPGTEAKVHRSAPYFKQYVIDGLDAIMESRSRDLFEAID